jgi:hypothetical protein
VNVAVRQPLQAPFPYFGGKSSVADIVWKRLGDVENYVEPFFGSGAVLLSRPHEPKIETVNDKDGFIANFWRACRNEPDLVAEWADWPVNERDLEARHSWLVTEGRKRLEDCLGHPDGFDCQVAGWWLWGICQWIGYGWCSGIGPWMWADGEWRKLGNAGRGINRKLPHLGDAGRGINRKLPHLGGAGRGEAIREWMQALAERLRNVRVCCGDWSRVCGPTPTVKNGLTGAFLDPPYSAADRAEVYNHDDFGVAKKARAWAISVGNDLLMRIAFCGYDGEFAEPWPDGWVEVSWKAKGGYGSRSDDGNGRVNAHRERIWFSPHCLKSDAGQMELFG